METHRVLRVFSRLNIGGPSLHVIHLSAGLTSRGYETKLVVGRPAPDEGDFHDLATARNVDLVQIGELGRAMRPVADLRALASLYRITRAYRPEIVHTHTAKAGALGRVAARLVGVPVVVHTYHGHVLSGYFHPVVSAFFRYVERTLARSTDVLLTVSESVKDDLVKLGVAPAARVTVMSLGLDLEPLTQDLPRGSLRRAAGWSESTRVVGIVGRLVPIKNLETFIGAAATVAASMDDVRFAVVGDGEERPRLEALAKSVLGDRVHFFGWRKDTPAVFGDIDLAVNSSLNEGTPVALIEALAAGRPVIATSVGGTPDVLEKGRFGELVPARSSAAMAAAILKVLSNREDSLKVAALGQEAVVRRYSVNRLLDEMAELYERLLRRG